MSILDIKIYISGLNSNVYITEFQLKNVFISFFISNFDANYEQKTKTINKNSIFAKMR